MVVMGHTCIPGDDYSVETCSACYDEYAADVMDDRMEHMLRDER